MQQKINYEIFTKQKIKIKIYFINDFFSKTNDKILRHILENCIDQ